MYPLVDAFRIVTFRTLTLNPHRPFDAISFQTRASSTAAVNCVTFSRVRELGFSGSGFNDGTGGDSQGLSVVLVCDAIAVVVVVGTVEAEVDGEIAVVLVDAGAIVVDPVVSSANPAQPALRRSTMTSPTETGQ